MIHQDKSKRPRQERRSTEDRRNINQSVNFPYRSKDGIVIIKDRRKTPDRRLNNINVEDAEIGEEEFLKNYQRYV